MLRVIQESHLRLLEVIKRIKGLYLCRTSDKLPEYEIIYRSSKLYLLCRETHLSIATRRFECITSLINTIFSSNGKAIFSVSILEKLLTTMNEHPNWLNIHIAAYVSAYSSDDNY